MTTTTEETQALIQRLCEKLKVADQAALLETPDFQGAYLNEHNKAPGVSAASLMGKALKAMRVREEKGVTMQAHVIEPRYNFVKYNEASRADKTLQRFHTVAIGLYVATPDGGAKFVKLADYDPLEQGDQFAAAYAARGVPANLRRGGPITLHNVDVTQDLLDDTVTVRIGPNAKFEAGGHNLPFPEGPDLESVIGKGALDGHQGAWRRDKKNGTITGTFGDIDNDPRVALLTITDETKDMKLQNFEDSPAAKHCVYAPSKDRKGNIVGIKYRLTDLEEQLGIPIGSSRETYFAKLRGQRVLVRGNGSIFMPKNPEDFGENKSTTPFYARIEELRKEGYLVGGGENSNLVLNLADKWLVDENGQRIPQLSVRIGDKDIYGIRQKGKDGKKWEIASLAADERKFPWMSCYASDGIWVDTEGGEKAWAKNTGAFILFLEGEGVGAELRDDDAFKNAFSNIPVPSFIQKLQQQVVPNGATPTPAPQVTVR